jgi:hypothetical protein
VGILRLRGGSRPAASGWGVRRLLALGLVVGAAAGMAALDVAVVDAAQPPTTAAQDGFVPMDDIPPEDQMPAAPLVAAAYAVVWAIAVGYLWTIWRRLGTVEAELADVARRIGERDGA